ncbi:MAG: superoxide dismutase, Ni [Pirellulales bacterium]|nr:superoxide dismutase, Ni [Pirellulales bacterium]
MKRFLIVAVMACATLLPMTYLAAHCEVPCGIYDDGARFAEMLEDQTTIAKAIASINDMSYDPNAEKINQMGRWITTKEAHATHTQHVIAQYFMTQRIKADDQAYVSKLTAAHGVMVAAMKCKQSTDPATADALKSAILTFKKAYGGEGSGKK